MRNSRDLVGLHSSRRTGAKIRKPSQTRTWEDLAAVDLHQTATHGHADADLSGPSHLLKLPYQNDGIQCKKQIRECTNTWQFNYRQFLVKSLMNVLPCKNPTSLQILMLSHVPGTLGSQSFLVGVHWFKIRPISIKLMIACAAPTIHSKLRHRRCVGPCTVSRKAITANLPHTRPMMAIIWPIQLHKLHLTNSAGVKRS